MRHILPILLTATACGGPEAARPAATPEAAPTATPKPPPALDLVPIGLIRPRSPFGAVVTGAQPGERVFLGLSPTEQAGGACDPTGALCLDLADPFLLGSAVADAQGVARIDAGVTPNNLRYIGPVYLQAVAPSGASDVEQKLAAGDGGAVLSADVNVEGRWSRGGDWRGDLYRSWALPSGDRCTVRATVVANVSTQIDPCPTCDFAFLARAQNWRPVGAGDCDAVLGLPPGDLGFELFGIAAESGDVLTYAPGRGWVDFGYPGEYSAGYYGYEQYYGYPWGDFYVAGEGYF